VRVMRFVLRYGVQCHRDAPHHGLAPVDSCRVRAAGGCAEEVFEPPTALQSLIDCCGQRRPPGARPEGFGTLGTDELGSFDSHGLVKVALRLTWAGAGGETWRQMRHHRAAAAWSSGNGLPITAVRRRCVSRIGFP
jgi:hypothetical protein